ncbi:hypothetical protein CC78DRAFT_543569 [Lojkania enalia]|uniref:Myb-like domain-containing protein n=1 Tax=Lojkania enalia TaxID=147567 RepID=A0A9P4K950_9PLEO|nr:hypothetical protein CC78DRAFT_543569 [Didymosphaeria enalia]
MLQVQRGGSAGVRESFPSAEAEVTQPIQLRRSLRNVKNAKQQDIHNSEYDNERGVSTRKSSKGESRSSSWSTCDEETLIAARAQGLNWNCTAPKYFPSKSPNACRKRHERLMERQSMGQCGGRLKFEELAQAYMETRKDFWSILTTKVGEKWQLVEQKCMEKSFKNLNQAYRSALRDERKDDVTDDSGMTGMSDEDEDDITELCRATENLHSSPRPQSLQPSLSQHLEFSSSLHQSH